ncbi:MAG: type II toxin-antitoxin system RelE/ParE family toxin [Candidatus Acidiferrum sp.]
MASYELSPESLQDLQSIWDYIASDNSAAADHIVDEFFEAFDRLAQWPESGHTRPDLTERKVLFWPIRSYLIVYRERTPGVQIVAILHGSRDIPSILQAR